MHVRRRDLERLLQEPNPYLQLVDQTADVQLARAWLTLPNIEGVVAKRADRPYVSGRGRNWVKVKRQRTMDCVVVGIAGEMATPKLVLALRQATIGCITYDASGVSSVIFGACGPIRSTGPRFERTLSEPYVLLFA